MEKFTTLKSQVIPLPTNNVDTDMIFPAQRMTTISRAGLGRFLFERLRAKDPGFPFNLEIFRGAAILAAEGNFGCGSSREHAVWSLVDWGIRVVIAKSFADIFAGNAGKNGLLLVTLKPGVVDAIIAAAAQGGCELTVDLEKQRVVTEGGAAEHFDYDPFRKHCLLRGLDDIDYIESHRRDLNRFRVEQHGRIFLAERN
jgi:3-isopropylmalate/(R)-2-methylmalate dehydratase small subunit